MTLRRSLLVFALLGALPLLGCQVLWASITSPSDWVSGTGQSISASFGALSTSSGSGGGKASSSAYRRDVRAFAAHFAATGGTREDFLRGLGAVAASHGVTHWESEPATLEAIGAGLRDAGIDTEQMDALAERAGDADPAVVALVREGYAGAR
jgi:hypothetical protein